MRSARQRGGFLTRVRVHNSMENLCTASAVFFCARTLQSGEARRCWWCDLNSCRHVMRRRRSLQQAVRPSREPGEILEKARRMQKNCLHQAWTGALVNCLEVKRGAHDSRPTGEPRAESRARLRRARREIR